MPDLPAGQPLLGRPGVAHPDIGLPAADIDGLVGGDELDAEALLG